MLKAPCRFENYRWNYNELQERDFLNRVFYWLRKEFGSEYDNYEFILYSANHDNPPVPLVLSEANKKYILIYISDESCSLPTHMSKYFSLAFLKQYLYKENNAEL